MVRSIGRHSNLLALRCTEPLFTSAITSAAKTFGALLRTDPVLLEKVLEFLYGKLYFQTPYP
jgi:hypothetical protein